MKDKLGHGSEAHRNFHKPQVEHGKYGKGTDFHVGQRIHAGFGAKGGAGFHGTVTKVSEHEVELRGEHKGPFGYKTYKAPKKFVSEA